MVRTACSCHLLSSRFLGPLEQFLARVSACGGLAQLLDGTARLAVQVLRDYYLDGDPHVARGAVLTAHALAADQERPPVRGARRDPHGDRGAAVRGHLDLRAEGRLGERHRDGHGQVGALAAEHRVRLDVHPDVQVAGRAAALARGALARELDPGPVRHPGRDAGLDGARAHRAPAARARRAGVVHHQAAAVAFLARLGDPERAQVPAGLPGALAGRAHPRHGAGLGAGAVTGRAGALAGQAQRHRGPVDRVAEGQRGLGLHVGAAPRPVLRRAAAAVEHAAEDVAQAAVVPGATEDVTEVEAAEAALLAGTLPGRNPEAAAEQRAGLVVLLAPLLVGQHRVRLGDLLEALLGRAIALVGVGVVLAGQLAVRRLDLGRLGCLTDPKRLVVILLQVILSAHLISARCIGPPACKELCLLVVFSGVPVGFVAAAVGAGRGLGDGDPGGTQDPLPDLVAGLEDLDAGVLGDVR